MVFKSEFFFLKKIKIPEELGKIRKNFKAKK